MGLKQYQEAQEQLPPKLLTEGARVSPEWLRHFLSNPALSDTDTNRDGVRPYLKVRTPTFSFSDNELRTLVRFFEALSQQPLPYIPEQVPTLTAKESDMARSLFSSTAAPCLKCHATGDPQHDKIATAPNSPAGKGPPEAGLGRALDSRSAGHQPWNLHAVGIIPRTWKMGIGCSPGPPRRHSRATTKITPSCWWTISSS